MRRALFPSAVGLGSERSTDAVSSGSNGADTCSASLVSCRCLVEWVSRSTCTSLRRFVFVLRPLERSRADGTRSRDEEDDGEGVSSQNTRGCFSARCKRFFFRNSAWFLASPISSSLLPPGGRDLRDSVHLPRDPWRLRTSVDIPKAHANASRCASRCAFEPSTREDEDPSRSKRCSYRRGKQGARREGRVGRTPGPGGKREGSSRSGTLVNRRGTGASTCWVRPPTWLASPIDGKRGPGPRPKNGSMAGCFGHDARRNGRTLGKPCVFRRFGCERPNDGNRRGRSG